MKQYVATFHTHLSALMTCNALKQENVTARMSPVPRALSSSCGTCVFYTAEDCCEHLLDEDTEAVYEVQGDTYQLKLNFE